MSAAGRAVVHEGPLGARGPAALLRGDVGGVLEDVVDGDEFGAGAGDLWARAVAPLGVPAVGHLGGAPVSIRVRCCGSFSLKACGENGGV